MGHEKDKYASYRFPGQKEGEQVKFLVRKHWVIDLKIGAIFLILGLIPLILGFLAAGRLWDRTFSDTFLLIALAFIVYLLFILLVTYIKWLNEELDLIIVTNERIISHEQVDLFHRQISETSTELVQDVQGTEQGFWSTLLHYGKLEIQTASHDVFFSINFVDHPYESARMLLDIRDQTLKQAKAKKVSLI